MMSDRDFNARVRAESEHAMKPGEVVNRSSLIQAIVGCFDPPGGKDADFFLCGTHRAVKAQLERQVRTENRLRKKTRKSPTLPGFEWIQTHYSITRDGVALFVPTEQMTDAEIEAKADEVEKFGLGAIQHARELRRYLRLRKLAPGVSSSSAPSQPPTMTV